jgi:uncharacterized protein
MLGTAINTGAILTGSLIGASIGSRLPEKIRTTVLQVLGLVIILIGLQMSLQTKNILVVLGALISGGVLGELLGITEGLEKFGRFLQANLAKQQSSRFGEGFVTASLVFCVGPMAILGSIQDGLLGDYRLLAVKAMLDGFISIAFAASLGWGVALSALSILIYQGSITLFASALSQVLSESMITEMTATGGLIIVGIGLNLLEIKDLRLANLLPALFIAPFIMAILPLVKPYL